MGKLILLKIVANVKFCLIIRIYLKAFHE